MRRRTALRVLIGGGLLSGSGCSEVVAGPAPYLESVSVANWDGAPHEFAVLVEQAGETVHRASFRLPQAQPREYGGTYHPGRTISCTWAGRGPFTVRCELDGRRTETVQLDAADSAESGRADKGTVVFKATDAGELAGFSLVEDDEPVAAECRETTPEN